MESQRRGHFRQSDLRQWRGSGQQVLIWIIALLCALALGAGTVQAQSINYVHDANGRVVAVTAHSGGSVQYSYNVLGHSSQISTPLSPSQLAIFAFTPTHSEAGTQVTIQGQGVDFRLKLSRVFHRKVSHPYGVAG